MKDEISSQKQPSLDEILNQTAQKCIDEWISDGVSQEDVVERIKKNVLKAYQAVIDQATGDYLQYMKAHLFEISMEHRQNDNVFIAHQVQKWGRCFAASEAMYQLVIEIAEDYTTYVAEKISEFDQKKYQYTYSALLHIHGRVCQIYLEILCLIKNGFADGAFARWRTMYELCYIADFIKTAGEDTALAYLQQSDTNDKHCSWAKNAPQITKKYASEIKRRGKKFSPNLAQIQSCCEFTSKWTEQYQLGCFVTHASPQGTLGRMANVEGMNVIPVGKSDYGIAEPAVDSAIVLVMVTTLFVTTFPSAEGLARIGMLLSWTDVVRDLYASTEEELFGKTNDKEDI